MIAAECMDLLDATIVNVAGPTIREELGASGTSLQWLAGGYALAIAAGLLPAASLGDVYGRRRVFLVGTVGFAVTSLLCGLAPGMGVLIACRIGQGLSASLMMAQSIAIVHNAFSAAEQPRAFQAFAPVVNLSGVMAPIVGGALVSANLFDTGWRLVFLVNLPLGALITWATLRLMPESRAPGAAALDVRGATVAALAMLLMVFPLIEGREYGWPAWAFAMMTASVLLFVLFGRLARRRERAGGHPLVAQSTLRNRGFSVGLMVLLPLAAGTLGLNLVLTLYFQLTLGYSPLHAGMSFAPWSLGAVVGGISGMLLAPRVGRRLLHAGLAVALVGTLTLLAVVGGVQAPTTLDFAGPMLVCGFGYGLVDAPLLAIMMRSLGAHEAGSAGGLINMTYQLGAAIGVAVLGTIFFSALDAGSEAPAVAPALWAETGLLIAVAAVALALPRRTPPAGS